MELLSANVLQAPMELEWTKTPESLAKNRRGKKKAKKKVLESEDDDYDSDSQLDFDLPDLVEFKTSEVAEPTLNAIRRRTVLQRAIALTDDGEYEQDLRKFLFICKVCKRTFTTINACEKHILNRGHTYPLIELHNPSTMSTETFDHVILPNTMDERDVKMVRQSDFLPIYMGKWSKVICELRHRFGQDADSDHGASPFREFLPRPVPHFNQPDVTQTQPKSLEVSPQADIARALEKINECYVTKGSPTGSFENGVDGENELNGSLPADGEEEANSIFCKESSSRRSSVGETAVSSVGTGNNPGVVNDVDAITPENSSLPSATSLENSIEHKIYVDFGSCKLLCEGCKCAFETLNAAASHWKNVVMADRSAGSGDHVVQLDDQRGETSTDADVPDEGRRNSENSEVDSDKVPDTADDADVSGNRNEADDKSSSQETLPDSISKMQTMPREKCNGGSEKSYAGEDEVDLKFNGMRLTPEEEELLIKRPDFPSKKGSKTKKRRRKGRNKPWKYFRRAFMLTITFLF